ncbi:MAG TPA: NAD(P)/FAD-dependent oxidoreductase [Flavisolibacter sp.]|jgi:thioredoxin reductase|nr:NAD(P)/FAD-dependent oxidoreductase [Flavisolibacter sp.]
MELQDCIIIGGGPAGLNAGVVLGRCRRRVLLFDSSVYRNQYSHGMHNYLTRDDILPSEFLRIAREELQKYSVQLINKLVVSARKNEEGIFVVRDENGNLYHSKKLLVATGLTDNIPEVEGFKEFYGTSVFHCPYCDGWEVRDRKIGIYARNKEGWELALALKGWSPQVTLYTDGKNKVKPEQEAQLNANGIQVVRWPMARLQGTDGQLEKIVFKNGEEAPCDAIFFVNGYTQHCNLAETFGCEMSRKGVVVTNRFQQTNIEGLYVAGDAARDMHFVVVAAAEGAKAGVIINKELQKECVETVAQKAAEPIL